MRKYASNDIPKMLEVQLGDLQLPANRMYYLSRLGGAQSVLQEFVADVETKLYRGDWSFIDQFTMSSMAARALKSKFRAEVFEFLNYWRLQLLYVSKEKAVLKRIIPEDASAFKPLSQDGQHREFERNFGPQPAKKLIPKIDVEEKQPETVRLAVGDLHLAYGDSFGCSMTLEAMLTHFEHTLYARKFDLSKEPVEPADASAILDTFHTKLSKFLLYWKKRLLTAQNATESLKSLLSGKPQTHTQYEDPSDETGPLTVRERFYAFKIRKAIAMLNKKS